MRNTNAPEDDSDDSADSNDGLNDKTEREKKQRVIHARVSEQLGRELERKAGRLGLSVSNLVRNVLQNTFGLVEDIVADSAEVARSARGEGTLVSERPPPVYTSAPFVARRDSADVPATPPRILGWQELVLGVNALCDRCNAILPKGTRAAVAVTSPPGPPTFLCPACLDANRAPTSGENP